MPAPTGQQDAVESKPLDTPKSDIKSPMDIGEFELKYGKERPDSYESAHADRVVRFGCDLSQVRGTIVSETIRKVFSQVSYKEERQYVFITSQWEEPVYDETGKVIDYVIRQETMHYPMKEDMGIPGAAQEPVVRMDRLPGMIGGRFMTASMIADVIFQYLICHTPINRQVNAMEETGLTYTARPLRTSTMR